MAHVTSVKCDNSESSSEEPLFVTKLQFRLTVHCLELCRDDPCLQPHRLHPKHSKGILKNPERDKEHRCSLLKSTEVCTDTMAAPPCQIKILAECVSMQPHEAQLEHNQSHSGPLLIISLNICPMPPWASEKRGTI